MAESAALAEEQGTLIAHDGDIVSARKQCRELASLLGFSATDITVISTAVSEIARNMLEYADHGEMWFTEAREGGRRGILIVAQDEGPGIPDVPRAMQDGYSSGTGLGLGLPGSKRLMDEFDIQSKVGVGTTVTMKKWVV